MHPSVMEWVAEAVARWALNTGGSVLEVGSFDVNGSVRPLFADAGMYLGVDIRWGPGVDAVVDAGVVLPEWCEPGFAVVVSTEMLEHDPRPWVTVPAMAAALRPGGHLVLTTRGFCYGAHDFPGDYWRYSDQSLRLLLEDAELEVLEMTPDPAPGSPGWFTVGRRG